jgi:hypothetical protein
MEISDAVSIASSELSTTSTQEFEHEPFSTFQTKVTKLCKRTWPGLATGAFETHRMEGGSYNRVISLKVDAAKKHLSWFERTTNHLVQMFSACTSTERKPQTQEYVIRMPRYDHAWTEYEMAILLFLSMRNVRAPTIYSFDLSPNNPLGTRYSIQPRLPGRSVEEVYLDFNNSQRATFAHSLGTALKQLSTITSPCPGTLDPDTVLKGSTSSTQILRLQCPPRNATRRPSTETPTPSTPMSVYDFITSQLTRQREYDISLSRTHINPWSKFRIIIDAMHAEILFTDNTYYLTHMDFEPRNILVNTTNFTLSGILDWDESVFAPAFVSCRPPSWLWDFEGEDDEELDETVADVIPEDEELREIKEAFEAAVGETWCRYAYLTEYRLARDIVRLAITGMGSSEDYGVAERVVREWNVLRPDCMVGGWEED